MSTFVYYFVAICMASAVCLSGVFFARNDKKIYNVLLKVFSLGLALVFVFRYMLGPDAISATYALSGLFESRLLNLLAILLVWFTYSSNVLLFLNGFFDVKRKGNFIRFFCFPISILNFVLLPFSFTTILGSSAISNLTLRGVFFALEIGVALGITATTFITMFFDVKKHVDETKILLDELEIYKTYHVLHSGSGAKHFFALIAHKLVICFLHVKRFVKKHWFTMFAVLVVLLSAMPSYTLQAIFGYVQQTHRVKSFEIPHRVILYVAIILPVILHYSLRNKDYKEKKFYLLVITLGTLLTYSFTKKFDAFLDPTLWPLHLCNTAMYIMPLVLIFDMKRFFYFTYFINVLGAFFAMFMPNYDAYSNMFSQQIVNFYVNHFIAFFIPILFVSLKMFERPKFKQFTYSMIAFAGYFVVVLFVNALYTGLFEVGLASRSTDFFFVNSDFIADKLGNWALNLRNVTAVLHINGIALTFYPIYQVLFFLVYIVLGFGMWFVYEQGYQISASFQDMSARKAVLRADHLALLEKLNGRSINEPMSLENKNKLVLHNFTKRYGNSETLAVDGANLEVYGGEIFGFLGPNGAGKSTIIKSIVGIQPITSGSIEVCGYDVNTQPIEAKRRIGFVPDHYALYEKLTGREYINYIADLYNVSLEDRTARMNMYVKRFELEGAFDNQIKTYSHGMKQKITIMAALVHNPKVWILDEPLTGLDPNSIFQVKECMKERAKEGNIVFFSSHIIDVVERICDRIAIIKQGHILLSKSVKEIEDSGETLEDFYMKTINGDNYKETLESNNFDEQVIPIDKKLLKQQKKEEKKLAKAKRREEKK